MTDNQWVKVHDPSGILPPCPDGTHYEVFHRGGYLMGGSYVNPYTEVRTIPNDYCNPTEEN